MATPVLLLKIEPRNVTTGARQTVRLAGGGANYGYRYDNADWKAGLNDIPSIISQLDFDGLNLALGAIPQALSLEWAPSSDADLNAMAALHWKDAPFTLYLGDENSTGTLPPVLITGKCLSYKITDSVLQLAMADPAADLKRPIVVDTFAGTGGVEGPTEWKGRRKRRVWGYCYDLEGEPIDPAHNIYCFSDPSKPLTGFAQVRDRGNAAASTTTLAWQGSIAATFTALQAAAAPSGGGVVCPSIGMVKWWTRPQLLCADIQGEVGPGYTETAAGIVNAILTARSGPALAAGELAATDAIRSASCGYVADDLSTEISAALDWILGGVSLLWALDATTGTIRIEPWDIGASVGSFKSDHAVRVNTFPPLKTRRIGYRRNHRPHAASDIAAILTYGDGTPIDDLQPAAPGADVTGDNVAAGINGQGALATQDTADWRTQVAARPAINELYYDFNYPSWGGVGGAAAAGWQGDPAGQFSMVDVPNSPGGKALVMGDGTTSTNARVFGPEYVPYNAGDLYEVSFDIEIVSAPDAATTYYLGVQAVDKAGNNLGGSYNYVGASGLSQNAAVGTRFIKKGYFTGWTSSTGSGQANDPLSPAGLPDGGAGGYGQGGVVKFRPVIYMNYNGKRGQTRVHAVRVVRIPARLATQNEVSFGAITLTESAGGSTATLANFKTGLGTAAAIAGQGYMATQNYVDWASRITGAGKPANNAGTANILVAFGSYSTVTANSVSKSGGTHGAFEGGAVGVARKNAVFISSAIVTPPSWRTYLGLDPVSAANTNRSAAGVWSALLISDTTERHLYIYKAGAQLGVWSIPGVATATDRFLLACNGVRVFAMFNGVVYGGDTSAYNATPETTYWPKVFDYYNTGSVGGTSIDDIQYGAWTDVRTFLDDGSTAINQAAYNTIEGIASGITGQGALAVLNSVDLATSQVTPNGGIPPTIPDNGFTYTSTNSSITITWPSMTVYRSNGTTISIASGSQSCTVLSASYNYKFYPYIVDSGGSSATIQFAAAQGALGTYYGSPSIAYLTQGSVAAKAYVNQLGRIDMGAFNAATTSGGTGGGGGGGWNCLHESMLIGNATARDVRGGDMVQTPTGAARIDEVQHHVCARWIEVLSGEDMVAKVTEGHLFYSAISGEAVAASDLRLGDILLADGNHIEVTGLRLCRKTAIAVGLRIADPHLHFAGQRRILCHNGTQKP